MAWSKGSDRHFQQCDCACRMSGHPHMRHFRSTSGSMSNGSCWRFRFGHKSFPTNRIPSIQERSPIFTLLRRLEGHGRMPNSKRHLTKVPFGTRIGPDFREIGSLSNLLQSRILSARGGLKRRSVIYIRAKRKPEHWCTQKKPVSTASGFQS